jgi:hypothetical protein
MAFSLFRDKAAIARQQAAERAKARPVSAPVIDGAASRTAERPQDRTIMAHTLTWANGLAPKARPLHLLELYPRVANRLALCWGDKVLTNRLFEDLLVDRRGGRKGFPPAVKAELLQLRMAYPKTSMVEASPTPHWDFHSQATSDR